MSEIKNSFLRKLSLLKESEDHIEFKEAKHNFDYNGGSHKDPKERRHCILGYVAALANEKGGKLVFGMKDERPHEVVGTTYEEGNLGALEDAIYEKMQIRVRISEVFEPSKDAPDRKRVIIFNVPSRQIGKMLRFEGVPLFLAVEEIWAYINQPTLNPQVHISENAYIFDIKLFNKETIREAVLNAITHRSMIVQNDVVIKQSPTELTITNAGGFPIGVDTSNVLTVNSTPRSKRLAEVLQKTGLVEKSGQGVDKMFTNCIMEAKALPDFSGTDNYQVSLKFRTEIRDVPFLIYIRQEQQRRPKHHKLNVFQLMAIYNVCFGDGLEVKAATVDELVEDGILLRSKTGKLSMAKEYKKIVAEIGHRGPVNGDVNGDVKSLKGVLKEIYMIVYSNPGIKTLRVAEIRRKSESTVWKQLNELRKKGIIEYRGSDRSGGYYVV